VTPSAREALLWILVPVVIQVAMTLYSFDAAAIGDWRAWAISLASLVVREVAKQVVGYLTARRLAPQNEHAP
jgi:hypothetical protein